MDIVFKALNDKTRREILELLKEKDLTAGEISDQFNMSKPTISHHLDFFKLVHNFFFVHSIADFR